MSYAAPYHLSNCDDNKFNPRTAAAGAESDVVPSSPGARLFEAEKRKINKSSSNISSTWIGQREARIINPALGG